MYGEKISTKASLSAWDYHVATLNGEFNRLFDVDPWDQLPKPIYRYQDLGTTGNRRIEEPAGWWDALPEATA